MELNELLSLAGTSFVDGVRIGLIIGLPLSALIWALFGESDRVIPWLVGGVLLGAFFGMLLELTAFTGTLQEAFAASDDPNLDQFDASERGMALAAVAFLALAQRAGIGAAIGGVLAILLVEFRRALIGAGVGFFIGPLVGVVIVTGWRYQPVFPNRLLPVTIGLITVVVVAILAANAQRRV